MFSYARLGRSLRRNLQVSIFFLAQREKLLTLYLKKALASPFAQTGAAQLNQNKIEGEVNRSVPSLSFPCAHMRLNWAFVNHTIMPPLPSPSGKMERCWDIILLLFFLCSLWYLSHNTSHLHSCPIKHQTELSTSKEVLLPQHNKDEPLGVPSVCGYKA